MELNLETANHGWS